MSRPEPRRGRVVIINIAVVLALLVVLGGTAVWLGLGGSGDTTSAVRTVPVGRGSVATTVAASGTVVSATSSSVGFSTAGEVTDVRVAVGDRVSEGQVLATLDDRSARAGLDAARASLTAAQAQLDDAEAGTPGGQATGTAQIDQLRSQVAQARASVVNAERTLDGTRLRAPQAGTVVSLDGRVGQTVGGTGTQVTSTDSGNPSAGTPSSSGAGAASGGSSGAGAGASSGAGGAGGASAATAFLSLADLDTLQVQAQIPELDVGQVRDGQSVEVSVNALPGRPLRGVVSGVNTLPASGASVQYGTTIGLEGRPAGLRLGQSASVTITTAQADGALFLPNAAIEPQGGATATQGTVLVYAGGREERRTVQLGLAADTVTQITGGLSVGDLAVLPEPATSPLQRGDRGGGSSGGSNGGPGGGNSGGSGSGGGSGGAGGGG